MKYFVDFTQRLRKSKVGYLCLLPSLLVFVAFWIFPLVFAFIISFHSWGFLTSPRLVGFGNYINIFQDDIFRLSLKNTLLYTLLVVPFVTVVSLSIAILLNRSFRGQNIFKSLYFIPVISSAILVSIVWKYIYDSEGVVNYFLSILRVSSDTVWLANEVYTLPALASVAVWQGAGYYMIIFLAGLQSIPAQLYEAAEIDGASWWQRFLHITFPLLLPVTLVVVVISTISSFQVFDYIYVLTSGGPGYASTTIGWLIYIRAFRWFKMGVAAAMGCIFFLIILVLSYLELWAFGKKVYY